MINDRLVWFLESNNLISGNQAGFRKNYSTNDHLVRLEPFICDAFIKKEHCVAIFFDLEKAYDTTWKYGIMKDLHDIGLRGRLPNFISNFLSDRSFNVRIGSTLSDTLNKNKESHKGVSCPLLCLIGFKFSKTKTQCVHFCQLRGLQKALKAKCLKALDVLKWLSNINWGGDRSVLLNLYRSLVRSKLDYGSIVYGSARKSYLKCLDTIHHQGLRLTLGAFCTSPVESLYAESNEPSLYTRREQLSLQYTTKLAANPKNPAYYCVFNPKYERFYNNTPSAIKPLGLRMQPLLEQANISIKNVQPFSLPSKEPWTQNPPKVILDLHKNKKSEVDSHIFKNEFLEIKSAYKHYMSIYTDGSKQDEKVACAVISPNFTDSIRLPDNSSIFTAEAKAIDIALYHIRDQPEKQFIIYSDSLSVLRSLKNLPRATRGVEIGGCFALVAGG